MLTDPEGKGNGLPAPATGAIAGPAAITPAAGKVGPISALVIEGTSVAVPALPKQYYEEVRITHIDVDRSYAPNGGIAVPLWTTSR